MSNPEMNQLLGSTVGVRLYDPENAMREALRIKMSRWLSDRRFDSTVLHDLRRISRNIMGLPRDLMLHRLPAELDALHCVKFNTLSPATLKGTLLAYCQQMGINMKSGPDLFGNDHWHQIVSSMEEACGQPLSVELAAMDTGSQICVTDPWVVASIMSQLEEAFSGETFNLECLKRVAAALDGLAGRQMHIDEDSRLVRQAWFGLYAQDGVRFDAMTASVRESFKDAVLTALCLNQSNASRMLGADAWTEICALEIPGAAPEIEDILPTRSGRAGLRYSQGGGSWLARFQQIFVR